jgi:hypothetical protein
VFSVALIQWISRKSSKSRILFGRMLQTLHYFFLLAMYNVAHHKLMVEIVFYISNSLEKSSRK